MKRLGVGPLPRLHWLCMEGIGPFRWWMFRPYCWLRRRHEPRGTDVYFEMCVDCGQTLWSRRRDGGANPYWPVRPVLGEETP